MFYRARFYDPSIGRFNSRDPAGLAAGINRYAYTNNNPINYTDPFGLLPASPVAQQNSLINSSYYASGKASSGGTQSLQTMVDFEPDGYDFSNGPVQVARADVQVWPRQGGGFSYRAADDRGSKPLQGTFNTGTSLNINQLPVGNYSVTPRPKVEEPGALGQIHDFFMGDRNQHAGRPTISNTDNWNQVRFPDGSIHEGVQIHPGREGTSGGNSLGCLVCAQPDYYLLNQMFNKNYNNGGVFLQMLPQAPKQ